MPLRRRETAQIPAAGYLRMSSDKQDTSIDGQRSELIAYAAKRGFQIVQWYTDEGISGWKNKQRQGFHRLIADAVDGGFKVILCWDQSRFSRFDPMEANYFWHQLRQAGVTIETIKEGKLDFESLGGWLSASVQQHAKAEYCRSLAHDVVRGRRRQIEAGKWICPAPYGYKLENGKLALGDAAQVEAVRSMFRLRAKGMGIRAIAVALREAGIVPKRAANWTPRQLQQMLKRKTYLGHMIIGNEAKGKFAHVFDDVRTFENTHPAIIDRELWDAAQRVNDERRSRGPSMTLKQVGGHLSGLLRCGCCGGKLFSSRTRMIYVCSTYHTGSGCACNQIKNDLVLRVVADKIRSVVLRGSPDALTAEIEKVLARRKAAKSIVSTSDIKRQIADVDRKLAGAAERLLDVDPSLVKTVQAAMGKLKAQRDALAAKLAEARQEKHQKSAREIAAGIWELDKVLREGDALTVRTALARIIDRVEIDFVMGRNRPRNQSGALGGTIFFRSIGDTSPRKSMPGRSMN